MTPPTNNTAVNPFLDAYLIRGILNKGRKGGSPGFGIKVEEEPGLKEIARCDKEERDRRVGQISKIA